MKISRKYLFVLYWDFLALIAVAIQIFLFKLGSAIILPITELTIISGILTGIYFGVNIVSKIADAPKIVPIEEVDKAIEGVEQTEEIQPKYGSRKFFLTVFWCIYMLILMIAQLFLGNKSDLHLPVMQVVTIASILTIGYFTTNILDKVTPSSASPPVPPAVK
jgi:hypothetical protein